MYYTTLRERIELRTMRRQTLIQTLSHGIIFAAVCASVLYLNINVFYVLYSVTR